MYTVNRRQMLKMAAFAAGGALTSSPIALADEFTKSSREDDAFLDDLERQGCLFFWEQGSTNTGQILDRARNDLAGGRDLRRMASIASTGFGLTALCIADRRGYLPHAAIVERVRATLEWHLNTMPEVHGFFYHFTDIETGRRWARSELSSIDTALLLCGVLTARAYFDDPQIQSLALQIYERVDWPWMLNGSAAFSMGWNPGTGFIRQRWDHYCELTMIYLLAMGSPTHPVSPEHWNSFQRPQTRYAGYDYVGGADPIFVHQYSHAWFDFRGKRDAYCDYFANSAAATRAHKAFCLSMPEWYSENYWGITASDSVHGYTIWGGPPSRGLIDGTVVPSAAAGSLAFVPGECIAVLRALRAGWGSRAWGRYGFVDAFHPRANWYGPDVLGIDQGISVLMAENLRSGFVWETFMRNPEAMRAMHLAGFQKHCSSERRPDQV